MVNRIKNPRIRSAVWYARCLPGNIARAVNKYKKGYDANYYTNPNFETKDYTEHQGAHKVILSAALYALGYDSYSEQASILDEMDGRHHTEQARILKREARTFPRYVVDVGGGRGELAALLQAVGVDTTVLDPSTGSDEMCLQTSLWFGQGIHHIRRPLKDIWSVLDRLPDCVIMCESIEHISDDELNRLLDGLPSPLKMIIVNHLDFWPIPKNSWPAWNHIRTIDDDIYDKLSKKADSVIFRDRSHLILQW